jgi:hypothetical protein
MSFQKKLAAGVQNAWLWFNDSDGFALGSSPTALSNNTSRGAYQFTGIQQMPSGNPEAEAVVVAGDDTTLGTILFSSDAPREFLINMGQGDMGLDALMQSTLVETMNNVSLGLVDPATPILLNMGLLVQSRTIKRENTSGQAAWSGFMYPNIQVQPLNREQFQGRTAASFRYKAVAQRSQYKPWGVTISDAANGDTEATILEINSLYPMTVDAFKLNGSPTPTFTLNKTPVSTTETFPFVERVAAAMTSVTPSTKVMVLTATGTAGQRGVVFYGYQ